MTKTFRALSALLAYPTTELQAAADELRAVFAEEDLVDGDGRRALEGLIDEIETGDIYDCQERYTLLFDRTRSLSLHLFEHVHGESRDRGQAMIDLQALYASTGLAIGVNELPDFIPLFLEFLSTRPVAEATALVDQTAHILAALAERLARRGSAYEAVFRALMALTDAAPEPETIAALDAEGDGGPSDLATLDAEWEDAPVTFGPEAAAGGCKDNLVARLRAAKRPAAAQT